MLSTYSPSETEDIVCDLYQLHGIQYASQLDLNFVAAIWGTEVWQYPFPAQAIWGRPKNIICLNTTSEPRQRRAEFFHELGHIALHVGSQAGLHQLFIELQEWQADRFQLVAAMPYYLLPAPVRTWEQYVGVVAETFRVPYTLALRRVQSIQARLNLNYF